jgi:hypothetical protein
MALSCVSSFMCGTVAIATSLIDMPTVRHRHRHTDRLGEAEEALRLSSHDI